MQLCRPFRAIFKNTKKFSKISDDQILDVNPSSYGYLLVTTINTIIFKTCIVQCVANCYTRKHTLFRVSKMASRTPPPSSKRHHNERMMFRQRHSRDQQKQPSKSRDSSPNGTPGTPIGSQRDHNGTPVSVIKNRPQQNQQRHPQQPQQVQQTAQVPAASPSTSTNEGKQASAVIFN